jgi:hypothetical protein
VPFSIETLDCNIFGDFKIGDNAGYNAGILSDLVEANEDGRFNKPIVLQAASLIEVAAVQIFYRAKNYNREGVPNIAEEDRQEIADKQIDKFAVIIDNLRKYNVLNGLGAEIYDDLHRLRRYRNKVHIQLDTGLGGVSRDEDKQFTDELMYWAIDLNWSVLSYLESHYARPEGIRGHVQPLRLPRPT